MMLHTNEKINEILEMLNTANERELDILLEFIRSLVRK